MLKSSQSLFSCVLDHFITEEKLPRRKSKTRLKIEYSCKFCPACGSKISVPFQASVAMCQPEQGFAGDLFCNYSYPDKHLFYDFFVIPVMKALSPLLLSLWVFLVVLMLCFQPIWLVHHFTSTL